MPFILKNDPVNLYFILNPDFVGEFEVKMKFTDPITNKVENQSIIAKIPTEPNF